MSGETSLETLCMGSSGESQYNGIRKFAKIQPRGRETGEATETLAEVNIGPLQVVVA